MHPFFSLHFFVFVASFSLVACVSNSERVTCDQRDWYELGWRDGSQGATLDRLAFHQKDCRSAIKSKWETLYINGRNAGLVEFCAPENAFELGRMGLPYLFVCPPTVEANFLSAYRRGEVARRLELEGKELNAKIDTLSQQMKLAADEIERRRINSELDSLRKRRAQNDRDLASVSK